MDSHDYDLSKSFNDNHLDSVNDLDELCSLTCKNENLDSKIDNNNFTKQSNISNHNISNKQTYPPLLNPKEVDYRQINPKLAWELNLPLPDNYKFVWVSNGGSGSEATMVFFEHCHVNLEAYWYCEKEKYERDFNMLISKPLEYNIICIHPRLVGLKYISLLQKTDFLYVAGDVISRLKVGLNHLADMQEQIKYEHRNPKLTIPITYTPPILKYSFPNKNGLPDTAQLNSYMCNIYTGFYEFLCNATPYIKNLYLLNADDLGKNNAFSTFKKLHHIFSFPQPPNDKKLFLQRVNMFRGGLCAMPVNLHINLSGIKSQIIINIMPYRLSLSLKHKINITQHFFTSPIFIDDMEILLLADEKDFRELAQHNDTLTKTKQYLIDYIAALEQSVIKTKAELVNEIDILQYLKTNKDICVELMGYLHDEIRYFKTYCPNIVASWKYYQEFEKIYKECL